jgi:hypothetical protein
MKARLLSFHHNSKECDGLVSPSCIYLVEGFSIWVEGLCLSCGKHVRVVWAIEELIMTTPNPNNKPFFKPPLKKTLDQDDKEFLKEMGIDSEDEENGRKK